MPNGGQITVCVQEMVLEIHARELCIWGFWFRKLSTKVPGIYIFIKYPPQVNKELYLEKLL